MGSDFILGDTSLLQPSSYIALTYVEVFSLEREAFWGIVNKQRCDQPELYALVRKALVRLAFQRGVLAEARRRRGIRLSTTVANEAVLSLSSSLSPGA